MKKKQPSYQPNPRFQKRLLAEKEARLDLLEQHLSQIDMVKRLQDEKPIL